MSHRGPPESRNRKIHEDALLKRAVAHGEAWRIRRGIYTLSDKHMRGAIDPLELAQLIHGPSYISMEKI